MIVVQDSREQRPFTFLSAGSDIAVEVGKLEVGDYSLMGFESQVAIERKELGDLIGCLSNDRVRFLRELDRARGMSFAIVVEASWDDLASGRYRSRMHPGAAAASVAAIMARRSIPIHFAGSREAAEAFTACFLRQFLTGQLHKLEAARDALQDNMPERRLPSLPARQN